MALPPVFAASALYDSLLQAALRQFFSRATFETEPIPSLSSDGRLAIEPTNDPSVLTVRWFGSRYVLHVPARRPFTPHEVRLAKAIGGVLALRYRAIFDPKQMLERTDLFRGAIEDRYVSAFLDSLAPGDPDRPRADLFATAIEVLRVAALSSYENHAISSGVLLLDKDEDREHGVPPRDDLAYRYSQALTGIKSFYRMCDGVRTLFLVNDGGSVLDVVDIARYARAIPLEVPCPTAYRAHALATVGNQKICIVLSPSHEIKVFAQGAQVFSFRNARWHLLDMKAKYDMWEASVGHRALAERLFQTAIDLADARQGALFVVLRDPRSALANARLAGRPARCAARHAGRGADPRADDVHAARADRDWTRSGGADGAGPDRWRDGHGHHRPPAGDRRHPAAPRTAGTALVTVGRRRPHHRGDGRGPDGRGAQGQRRRPDHLLRSAGADLGYLGGGRVGHTRRRQLPASGFRLPASSFPLPARIS